LPLAAGQALAHYRITAALGAGGMGEVDRATDTELGREVALKLLPAELAQDRDRLARFEREARLLATLNHPGIGHIYGFESRQNEMSARFSRDGRSVAYMSDESGRHEVYLQSFPTPGRALRISRDGGLWPEWSKDGRELYFIAPDARGESDVARGTLMAAAIEREGPDSQGSSPQALFGVDTVNAGRRAFWPGADGRFLIGTRVEDPTPRLLTVVLNWKAALKGQ
jgi:hypothetical protein